MEANQIEIKPLLISIASIVSIDAAARFVIPKCNCDPLIILGAARILEITLIILIVLNWGKGISSIGLAPSKMVQGFKKGLVWSAGFGMFAGRSFIALFLVDIDPLAFIKANLPKMPGEIILFFSVAGVVGPMAEEAFFRGIIYGYFRKWGFMIALVLSTTLFVLAHPIAYRLPLPQVVGGILFAVSYEVEENLIVPITIHVMANMAVFAFSLIS